jgi:ComF family protein
MATRGFNQAQLIVKTLAKTWQLPSSFKLLQRIKNTIPQAELKKADRIKNLQGAFAPDPRLIQLGDKPLTGKNLIIIDDVWTTGSTLQEAAKVLHKLGAKKVWGLTIAR